MVRAFTLLWTSASPVGRPCASCYGTSTSRARTRKEAARAVEREVDELAADHGLETAKAVLRGPDEWVLSNPSGEEIARWEIA